MKHFAWVALDELWWLVKWPLAFMAGIILYAILATSFIQALRPQPGWGSDPCSAGCTDTR